MPRGLAPGAAQLKLFAMEAEAGRHLAKADRCYTECLALAPTDPQAWFDYGCFCMRRADLLKAEEAFQQVIVNAADHVPAMLALGALCYAGDRLPQAAKYLRETATGHADIDPMASCALEAFCILTEDGPGAQACREQLLATHAQQATQRLTAADFFLSLRATHFTQA